MTARTEPCTPRSYTLYGEGPKGATSAVVRNARGGRGCRERWHPPRRARPPRGGVRWAKAPRTKRAVNTHDAGILSKHSARRFIVFQFSQFLLRMQVGERSLHDYRTVLCKLSSGVRLHASRAPRASTDVQSGRLAHSPGWAVVTVAIACKPMVHRGDHGDC